MPEIMHTENDLSRQYYGALSAGNATAAPIQHVGAVDMAVDSLNAAAELARRVTEIVERICGVTPKAVSNDSQKLSDVTSSFDRLRRMSNTAAAAMSEAHSQLDRLSREI